VLVHLLAAAIPRWWSLIDRCHARPSRERDRCVWSTANTGCAAIKRSVFPHAAITQEWKSRL
jgi:hypothetical protein